MSVPSRTDPLWRTLVCGTNDPSLAFPTKLLLQRLRQTVRKDPSQTEKAIQELHSFFLAHSFAQSDLKALLLLR
jgi:hypothetical protein